MIKKRLNFVSNSSSQSFIISYKNNTTPEEVYKYLESILLKVGALNISENVIVKYYKDLDKEEKHDIDSWYKEDPYEYSFGLGKNYIFNPMTIIVMIDENYWPWNDKHNCWYKLKSIRRKYKIKNRFFSMHMG